MNDSGHAPAVRFAQPTVPINAPTSAQNGAGATPAPPRRKDAPETLLRAAELLKERGRQYDAQDGACAKGRERSMARTVAAFNALHGTNLTTAQGWSFMLLLKLVRLFCAPGFHEDSADDAVAYAALLAEGKAGEGA